jgi:PIN domain nuclease of toxin-antitoxin system
VDQGLGKDLSAYLDTHVAVWLYAGMTERISTQAKRKIEENDLLISPMVLLEFQYLYDRKRISVDPVPLYAFLNSTFGIGLCNFPFPAIALASLSIPWTCDPFDRIIVAQAQANHDAALITADAKIRRHYSPAVW